jgi:hypothetical protein
LAIQDIHKGLSVQKKAFGSRKLLKAFSLVGWTLEWIQRNRITTR